jgi:hypothetical protein
MVFAEKSIPELDDTHSFRLGAVWLSAYADILYNRPPLPETELDLGDIALEDRYASLHLRYRWRFTERWSLDVSAQRYKSDGNRSLQADFNWGGEVIPAGADLDAEFTVDTYIADVLYSVIRNDRFELALGGGVHAFDTSTDFKAEVSVGEQQLELRSASSTLLAPLPNLRARAVYALHPNWTVGATLGWLSASIDDYSGSFTYLSLNADYRFGSRFGIGVGYQFTSADIEQKTDSKRVRFDMGFDGPSIFLTYSL